MVILGNENRGMRTVAGRFDFSGVLRKRGTKTCFRVVAHPFPVHQETKPILGRGRNDGPSPVPKLKSLVFDLDAASVAVLAGRLAKAFDLVTLTAPQ